MITLPFLVPLLSLVTALFMISGVISTSFTIANNCSYTVWPALVSDTNGSEIPVTGFKLETGDFTTTSAAAWSGYRGRMWGRTNCIKDPTGNFSCLTDDCGTGKIECAGAQLRKAPTTLAEFSLNLYNGNDYYDVSLVEGFNLPILVVPQGGGSGSCNATGCVVDVNSMCPSELKVLSTLNRSMVVGCKSACEVFRKPEYCCPGAGPCGPSSYSRIFKQACPHAYSYTFDDRSNTFTCPSTNYVITFCPSATTSYSSSSPAPPPLVEPPSVEPPLVETPVMLPPANTTTTTSNTKNKSRVPVYISVPSVIAVLATLALWFFCFRKKKTMKKFLDDEIQSAESLQFSFNAISIATDDFSDANKLGEGGFGSVYKGVLLDGQEIAVKRLSKSSGQGEREFKTEVILLAKLQHRNLVRLLGFCLEEEEKLLIYEFMPNASLDQFIFDPIKRAYLTWNKRYKIIGGIARGLLYLHEESRLKIIHRDLKANNILLDAQLNPKISDFGMARLFEVDQSQANTNKIVGTYGYMAPEYVKHGQFSTKSDVFSFGVLVLEIISGKKNTSFYESEVAPDLLSYAWINLKNGKGFELVDESLRDNCSKREVMRCIHIGMLCVQENICDRPTMASVVLMLNSYSNTLPLLASPAFFASSNEPTIDLRRGEEEAIVLVNPPWSLNEASLTDPYPR